MRLRTACSLSRGRCTCVCVCMCVQNDTTANMHKHVTSGLDSRALTNTQLTREVDQTGADAYAVECKSHVLAVSVEIDGAVLKVYRAAYDLRCVKSSLLQLHHVEWLFRLRTRVAGGLLNISRLGRAPRAVTQTWSREPRSHECESCDNYRGRLTHMLFQSAVSNNRRRRASEEVIRRPRRSDAASDARAARCESCPGLLTSPEFQFSP